MGLIVVGVSGPKDQQVRGLRRGTEEQMGGAPAVTGTFSPGSRAA